MQMYDENYDDEVVQHHGIKGMRWGVRRTPAQLGHKIAKKPLSKLKAAYEKGKAAQEAKREVKQEVKRLKHPTHKRIEDMTNEELQAANTRSQLEENYKRYHPQKVSLGKRFVKAVVGEVLIPAAKSAGKDFVEKSLKQIGNDVLTQNASKDKRK